MKIVNKSIKEFNKPTIWTYFSSLALQTNSVNLGQGFPSWQPPSFFKSNLSKLVTQSSYQYTRAPGSDILTKTISQYYSQFFNRKIDHLNEIVVTAGGVQALCSTFGGLLNDGDEVILIQPFYDCYLPQVKRSGGKAIGIPMKWDQGYSKQVVLDKLKKGEPLSCNWQLDFDSIQKRITERTKFMVINTPHNPSGKILSEHDIHRLKALLDKFPNLDIISDQVYQHINFGQGPFKLARIGKQIFDRTITICSAGKLFSATGIRIGWAIGPQRLIKGIMTYHQYNVFCLYGPLQLAVAESLKQGLNSKFFQQENSKMRALRDNLLKLLAESNFKLRLWVPEGGYFILADISQCEVQQKYYTNALGQKLRKDFAFAQQLARKHGVICIPISPFFTEENQHKGTNLVRFAFCKGEQILSQAAKRLK